MSKKSVVAIEAMKMSDVRKACNMFASLATDADAETRRIASEIEKRLNTDNMHVVFKDTTSCVLFVVDANNNTVFNVYDTFRIQFTTKQVAKYRDALLANEKFAVRMYKQKEFIEARSASMKEFFENARFAYDVVLNAQRTTVEKVEDTQSVAK